MDNYELVFRGPQGGPAGCPSIITTTKQDSSRASPEMAKLKGKRFACMSEPERSQKLQISLLKRLTGGDQIQARELFKDAVEFKLSSTFIVLMNNKPSLNDFDGGITRRLNVIDFPYKFVETPILSSEKSIDHDLDARFKTIKYAQELMLMLVENYRDRININNCIEKPDEVLLETKAYLEDNNVVKGFINKYLTVTNDHEDMIQSSTMYEIFRYSEYYNQKDKTWFKEQMTSNGLKAQKKTTRGENHNNVVYYGVKETEKKEENDEIDNKSKVGEVGET